MKEVTGTQLAGKGLFLVIPTSYFKTILIIIFFILVYVLNFIPAGKVSKTEPVSGNEASKKATALTTVVTPPNPNSDSEIKKSPSMMPNEALLQVHFVFIIIIILKLNFILKTERA